MAGANGSILIIIDLVRWQHVSSARFPTATSLASATGWFLIKCECLVTVPDWQTAAASSAHWPKKTFAERFAVLTPSNELRRDSAPRTANNARGCSSYKGIHILTCDKEELRDNITRSGDRPLALDAGPERGDSRTIAVRQIQASLRQRAKQQEAQMPRLEKSHGISM
jgi:hypothetical protein